MKNTDTNLLTLLPQSGHDRWSQCWTMLTVQAEITAAQHTRTGWCIKQWNMHVWCRRNNRTVFETISREEWSHWTLEHYVSHDRGELFPKLFDCL